jgi:RNA polymerase sigma factor (sigma-70 family)
VDPTSSPISAVREGVERSQQRVRDKVARNSWRDLSAGGVTEAMEIDDGEVWRKHSDELIRFAATLVGRSDAEDVLAIAFCAATSTPAWPSITNQRAYLFRAVTNHAHRHRRALQRRLCREIRASPHEPVEDKEMEIDILNALGTHSVRQRAVLWLTYWLGLTTRQTGEILSLSNRTVERALNDARAKLRKTLQ